MADNNNILSKSLFKDFFLTKEEKEKRKLKKEEIKKQKVHHALTNLYTYGAQPTGLEEVTTKDLYAYFSDVLNNKNFDDEEMAHIVAEISNRVLKKLKTPAVNIDYYIDLETSTIANIDSREIKLNEIEQNTYLNLNLHLARELSLYAVFHECKHLTQKYALHNMMRGFITDNNETLTGVIGYLNLLNEYKYFSYDLAPNELDANIFAYNLVQKSYEKGLFDELTSENKKLIMLKNYIFAYTMLKNFKVVDGQIDSKIQKQLVTNLKQGIKDLHQNKFFTTEQLQKIDNLDIDTYFKNLNSQLSKIENDFKYQTIDYKKKYGVQVLQGFAIDENEFAKSMYLLQTKIKEECKDEYVL